MTAAQLGLLAHSSGFAWDEALLVAFPVLTLVGLLALARRRVQRANPPDDQ
jgi:hypothetical protein